MNRLLLPVFRSLETSYSYDAYAMTTHTCVMIVACHAHGSEAWQSEAWQRLAANRRCPGVERGGKKAAVHGMDVAARASNTCRLVRSS